MFLYHFNLNSFIVLIAVSCQLGAPSDLQAKQEQPLKKSPTLESQPGKLSGVWTAELQSPGGALNFEIKLRVDDQKVQGQIVNGQEVIPIEKVEVTADSVAIRFPHYDSVIQAKLTGPDQLTGEWTKTIGENKHDVMRFSAKKGPRNYTVNSAKHLTGRYEIKFESSDDLAVGLFELKQNASREFIAGTFLTTTGDYRFLAGDFDANTKLLTLSCFDGGHAFLFKAKLKQPGRLAGQFWSRSSWNEKWVGKKNSNAKIADGFKQVNWAGIATSKIKFPDLDGKPRSLSDPSFKGKVKIVQVFGSWCPNCHDASKFLNELQKDYQEKGLSIVGLAFELTADPERSRRQIKNYRQRTGAQYPILIAGLADKETATKQLKILSRVKSYPTTIFLDKSDRPIAIHSGFTGPATGQAYELLKKRFRMIIEKQLKLDR